VTRAINEEGLVIMMDEIFDRHYQVGRTELNASITSAFSRLGKAVDTAFAVLNRIAYSEPWKISRKSVRVRCTH
jgi:hypothetical protein